jgi:cellulose synthase/poly-beta-1,6-N-acetylglucosamine synthase-like glycosyltransferase
LRGIDVKVTDSDRSSDLGEGVLKFALALVVIALALAPGWAVPEYYRWLTTVLFVALAAVVARAYLAAGLSFRPGDDPPPAPDGDPWPTVSVLVPAYNEAGVLPETMERMLEVEYPADRIEFVYVCEVSSTDETMAIARRFAERDDRFVVVERDAETGGKAAACNDGLEHCTGELVVSIDADHVLAPRAVKRAARWFLADDELGCVKGRCIGANTRDSYLALQAKVERDTIEKGDIYAREVVDGFTFFGGGQGIFRREVFEALGDFDEDVLTEDSEFSVRLHEAGYRLRVDPKIHSFEENPVTLRDWWAQRKRWARGWMQVAVRYLPRTGSMPNLSRLQRVDMAHTLLYVIVPVSFVLLFAMQPLDWMGVDTSSFVPSELTWMWAAFAAAPLVLSTSVVVQDLRDGIEHDPLELPAMVTLWAYLIFQTAVFWSAFLDEFVLGKPSVYVKTSKSGTETARPGDG